MQSRSPVLSWFVAGILAILGLSLAIFYLSMHPPMGDLGLMAIFLAVTAAISGLVGFIAYRLGWLERMPSLRLALVAGYAIASLLTFFNVWMTAQLMFASPHDLQLAIVLLFFASGIAMLLGYFLSSGITRRIGSLEIVAGQLAAGDLSARASVEGKDEVASLANAFNQMAARLQEADRKQRELEALRRDLVAWASHDLQTPLTAIRVQVEALADGLVDDQETVQRYLRTTQRQVKDLSALIDDLFQIAQMDAGGLSLEIASCSLADLISDTLESFAALASSRKVMLTGSIAPDVDPVNMDASRIGRVLVNLIGNALRHTPAGGSVEVTSRRVSGAVILEVQDTGEGINPEDLPHVFDRFYRSEKSRSRASGGAGLGLAIARGIVEAHGGQIYATSQPEQGTRFVFTLPA